MRSLAVLLFLPCAAWQLYAAGPASRPALIYSKPFGGQASDFGVAAATDSSGNVYITGITDSPDFPVKNGFQPKLGAVPFRASLDNGKTWAAGAIPEPVFSVAGSAKQPWNMYAGTSSAIYKSTDSGKSWNRLDAGPRAQVNALVVDSANPSIVYAGTGFGLFQTKDAGATWSELDPEPGLDEPHWNVIDLVANAARPSTVLAGISLHPRSDDSGNVIPQVTLYRSTDSGATWTPIPGLSEQVISLAGDPANPDVLYATTNPYGFGNFCDPSATSVYKTTDAGNTWVKINSVPAACSTFALATGPSVVYAATINGVMRSGDGGATWKATALTASADTVTVDPNDSKVVYASAGGIAVSTDGGTTWKTSLPIRQNVQTVAAVPGNPGLVFVGATPGQNVFITKWSGDGTQMIYSTYLGGSYYDVATAIAVDGLGNAYVTGYTYSTDFPVTKGALQSKTAAAYAVFLAKISPDGRTLTFSTYLGGSTGDAAFAIAVDGSGNAYLTGNSGSADFPVTSGAFQSANKDKCTWKDAVSLVGDAFVSKIASDGGSLLYSTLLGGSCGDQGLGIAVDSAGIATVVGLTESADFPVTRGSFRATWPGVDSGFVARLTTQGTALSQASFIGGTYSTTADAVALDSKGNLYITGCSEGFDADYYGVGSPPIWIGFGGPGLAQAGFYGSCAGVAYVLKLDSAASSKAYLSYIDGPTGEASNIAVDPAGRVWIAGSEEPEGFPWPDFQTVHPFQTRMGEGFVAEWSADGATLLFSSRADSAYGMAMDGSGNVFLTGYTDPPEKLYYSSAFLARIDGSVPSTIDVEDPQRITPIPPELIWTGQPVGSSEILAIPGSGMGPAQQVGAQIGSDGRLAATLAGTSVTFDGVAAPLISVQSDRIVCMVPFGINSPTTMQVHRNGADSNSIRMPFGYVVEALAISNADGTANTTDRPAPPGSIVTVYAAGFGQTEPLSENGEINTTAQRTLMSGSVAVTIFDPNSDESWPAEILFAGPAPRQIAGITQVNFRVPQLGAGAYTAAVGLDPITQGQGTYDNITLNVGQR